MTDETKQETWEDNEFDQEFEEEDDNDSEFNENGNGWTDSEENVLDPFETDTTAAMMNTANTNNEWGDIDIEDDASEMENEYWNGYYEKTDTESALQSFLKVIELGKNGGKDTENYRFKSLTEIVILYFETAKEESKIIDYFNEFLLCSAESNIKPNELSTNLQKILNRVKTNESIYDRLYDLSMAQLNSANETTHLWFKFGIERCHQWLEMEMYTKCESLSEELHKSVSNETAKLLQVYAVKIRLSVCLIDSLANVNQTNKALQISLAEMIRVTQALINGKKSEMMGVTDNKAMSVIYECWAKVYASNNDWLNAYKYFKESFLLYSQIAHTNTAKCLKYLLISYMILYSFNNNNKYDCSCTNPFAMDEIKVYETHSEIVCIRHLLTAFENDNIHSFNRLLKQLRMKEKSDVFILKWIGFVQFRLEGKALLCLVQSYDRVRLDWLALKLGMGHNTLKVERLIVKLIIDCELNARLDQCEGILILRERNSNKSSKSNNSDIKILTALQNWLKSVNRLRENINGRNVNSAQLQKREYGFGGVNHFEYGMDDDIYDDLSVLDSAFLAWD